MFGYFVSKLGNYFGNFRAIVLVISIRARAIFQKEASDLTIFDTAPIKSATQTVIFKIIK